MGNEDLLVAGATADVAEGGDDGEQQAGQRALHVLRRTFRFGPNNQQEAELVDVRTRPEYDLLHISGVSHQPELVSDPGAYRPSDPEKPVVVICMTGHRSPIVAYRLKKRGIDTVYNLTWGMVGWKLVGGKTK